MKALDAVGERRLLPDAVAEHIQSAILRGELRAGDRLPPERALAERLNVNRSSVREGLKKLEQLRLVEIQQGSGIRVRHPEEGSFDLIWSEGAIYFLGFEAGLRLWRDFLAPDGIIVVSECSWLTDDRPSEVETFWRDAYPTMGSVAENRARAISAGFDLFDSFVLPASDWWDNYHTPLLARLAELRSEADAGLRAVIEDTEREIDLYRRYGDTYGYVFYLMALVQ